MSVANTASCTVLLNGKSARSCLTFAVMADGATIETIEGLSTGDELHPLQKAFWENHGLQCGFCTPGMLMVAHELLRENPAPTRAEIREALTGNLCRCTGYQTIVESIEAAAAMLRRTPS
jgi:carbon-monoxide dehydrogenase small subunit